ncbi:MAG: carboxypeptidase-like regulatory domain-containing protein, partial [Bacteroidota bacterium]
GSNNTSVGNIPLNPLGGGSGTLVNPTFAGTVWDGNTGAPLFGVNLIAGGTSIGTITDIDGKYAFAQPIPPGNYSLNVSYVGYQAQSVPITVGTGSGGVSTLDVNLFPDMGDVATSGSSDLLAIKGIVAETGNLLGITEDESVAKISETFINRSDERTALMEAVKDGALVNEQPAFTNAEKFLKEDLSNPKLSNAKLAKQYESTIALLTESFKTASAKEKTAYRRTIEVVTHAYMDKLALRNPKKLDKRSEKALNTAGAQLSAVKISPTTIHKKWQGAALKKELKFGVVDDLGSAIKKTNKT